MSVGFCWSGFRFEFEQAHPFAEVVDIKGLPASATMIVWSLGLGKGGICNERARDFEYASPPAVRMVSSRV
jgi:hypothetical protein